jgi:GntR family transcriptional regulator of arabinose operon
MKEQHPKYILLKNEILSWIGTGRFKPDEQLPSEHELSEQFGFSRQTVRQAVGELEKEGRVYRVQGKGTFVAAGQPARGDNPRMIGILTTYISDYIFPFIVRGAESALRRQGYRLLLSSTDNDKAKERESLDLMLRHSLSGLIVEPTKSAEGNPNVGYFLSMEHRGIPYLTINETYPELDCPCLKVDDELGGFRAAEHLLRLGHRRIAGFFKTDDMQGVNRMKGFIRAHREFGCSPSPEAIVVYNTQQKETKPAAMLAKLLTGAERPTAIVSYNDELAVKLLNVVRSAGFGVPGDLSVVGFDDSSYATATEVKLTTLTHPKMEMGTEAAELLLSVIAGKKDWKSIGTIVYEPKLIVRESTRSM